VNAAIPMELSSEDSLRLNVLLANAVAVRIDEGTLRVYGLSRTGDEAQIQLNPNCRPDQYVRRVRELLSSRVLGSPGGYPVFLKRWTRMGQTRDARLADLLMLGEPEAVVAVAGAHGLTDDLAARAWWAMPDAANARRMLTRDCVAKGVMGKALASFLVEFLPFEEEPRDIIDSVRLVLQPGLIDDATRMEIWNRGRSKSIFRIGFLQAQPDALPEPLAPRADAADHLPALDGLSAAGNPFARILQRVLSGPGQTYVQTCEQAFKRPSNQDAVCELLDTMGAYFFPARITAMHFGDVTELMAQGEAGFSASPDADRSRIDACAEIAERLPALAAELRAIQILAHVGEPLVRTIFSRTDAVGSVMRRKLEPVTAPILKQLAVLRGT